MSASDVSTLGIVQFIHPGAEHNRFVTTDAHRVTPWNPIAINNHSNSHARKYLQHRGRWVRPAGERVDGKWKRGTGSMQFWCEWEPESILVSELQYERTSKDPRHLVATYWSGNTRSAALHTTDPFVFGNHFLYYGCKQTGRLTNLEKGSVILFGSENRSKSGFMIDTVFVVDDWIEYDQNDPGRTLANECSPEFLAITVGINSRGGCAGTTDTAIGRRLYFGATVANPVNGMFSFFPCRPGQAQDRGFERPIIRPGLSTRGRNTKHGQVVNDRLSQGVKITPFSTVAEVVPYWNRVAEQIVENNELALGTYADMPVATLG